MTHVANESHPHSALETLLKTLDHDIIATDDALLTFYANDIFWQPEIKPLAIITPRSADEVTTVVRLAKEENLTLLPRTGGMSYAKGYLPPHNRCVVIDLSKLNRILEINTNDHYITAEAGCSWATLYDALKPTGLRTPYWGPMSGKKVTVGGALSHMSAFFGSGLYGTIAESVLGVAVVLPNGELVNTGAAGRLNSQPFTRYSGGPDLTGLFLGDNGTFGIKVAATFRLIPRPQESGYLSFGFPSMKAMATAQVAMARLNKISESFGIDRAKAAQSSSFSAIAGNLLQSHACTLHLMVDANTPTELSDSLAALRTIGLRYGKEIDHVIPKTVRQMPFGPLRGALGIDGERWVPTHAVFPLSKAEQIVETVQAHLDQHSALLHQHGILTSHFTMNIGAEYFFETAFYWQDEITPLHTATVGEEIVQPWTQRQAAPATRQIVAEIRRATQELYANLGGASWQVARDYPFQTVLKPETWSLMQLIKQALDPHNLMNPGALGIGTDEGGRGGTVE